MSHVVKADVTFSNLETMKRAFSDCGMEIVEKDYITWFRSSVGDYPIPQGFYWELRGPRINAKGERLLGTCDYAARIIGANPRDYELGICKNKDGTFTIYHDFYGSGSYISRRLGNTMTDYKKFEYAYALRAAEMAAQQQGWTTQIVNGKLEISIYDLNTQQISTVTVSPDTEQGVRVEADGFVGSGCTTATNIIADAIGVKAEEVYKPEYYEVQQTLTQEY